MSGGNMRLYHTLVLAVTNAAVVGCAVTVGLVTYELTDDEMASFTSGLALFALPAFHWRAAFGFKPKYFVVLFGLLAVYLALRDHSFLAGVAGAASVGYWQLGVIFPLLALGILHQRSRRQGVIWMFVGGGIVTTVMLAPIVWWGAVDEMFVETVLTPLVVSNDAQPVLAQLRFAVRLFGRTLPLVLLGTIGVFLGVRRAPRTRWWLLPGALWFAVQIAILDLDAYPDLIPGFAFVALGLGLVLGDPPHRQHAVHGLVVVMVIISVVTLGPLQVAAPTHPPEATAVNAPYWGEERPALLWRTIPTETCRPFFGATEAKIVNHVGGSLHDRVCGDFTSMWTAFRQQYLDPI